MTKRTASAMRAALGCLAEARRREPHSTSAPNGRRHRIGMSWLEVPYHEQVITDEEVAGFHPASTLLPPTLHQTIPCLQGWCHAHGGALYLINSVITAKRTGGGHETSQDATRRTRSHSESPAAWRTSRHSSHGPNGLSRRPGPICGRIAWLETRCSVDQPPQLCDASTWVT